MKGVLCNTQKGSRNTGAVYRCETDSGKQSQFDLWWGFSYIEIDGKRRKLYTFSMILEYSRIRCAELTIDLL